ncbi:MAG TPA: FixH family protein [Hyphomicrobium sp.]|nr:FixH family protein [Hyphomicrobium sp.]
MSKTPLSRTPDQDFVLTGRHVLFALLGFFGVVFAVNAYFIDKALSTNTGVVSNEPYRKGLKYNERIEAAERQAQLGWRDDIKLSPAGDRLSVDIRDKDGKAVDGLTIKATVGRPASEREDITVTLAQTPEGTYEAAFPPRAAGTYVASIEAVDPVRADEGILYRAKERIWLKP